MQKLLTFFSAKILVYPVFGILNDQSFNNDRLTKNILSFEQVDLDDLIG